jgi:alkylated DNA repair dioxygenase AlkB
MSIAVQDSLLDAGDDPAPGALQPQRVPLSRGAWIDVQRGWLTGSAALFARLTQTVPWRAERRRMYDRTVDVPRLVCFYGESDPLPDPALDVCRAALSAHYAADLGEELVTAGLCFYRDGRDSVAWHGDLTGRGATQDTMVAIVSLGTARPLLLRPAPGSAAAGNYARGSTAQASTAQESTGGSGPQRYSLGHGDLLVMGGSCQRTWEHAVPKSSRPTGPRISVQFRPRGVR